MAKAQTKNQTDERERGLREKMIAVNRVTKVVKGGRNLSFAALAVVGDGHGSVGMGKGKAKEVPIAVQKAMEQARRNMFKIPLKNGMLQHQGRAKHGASKVLFAPGKEGMICSPVLRSVFYVAGARNVVVKRHGSSKAHNLVRAVLNGLRQQSTPANIAAKRGKSVEEILANYVH